MYENPENTDRSFQIPFRVSPYFYYVPEVGENKEGAPKILNLRDLTGEGVAGQFALFDYAARGAAMTAAFSYSPQSGPFSIASITWDPRHGVDRTIHEQVWFDRGKQVFVGRQTLIPCRIVIVPGRD